MASTSKIMARFLLRRGLPALTRTSGFDSLFGLALVLDKHFGLRFKFRGNFGLGASRSSTASVLVVGIDACFGFPWALRRVPSAIIQHQLVTVLGRRQHSGRAPALASGERLNRARTGNLPQPPALLSMNPGIPLCIYCSYSNAEFCRQRALQQGIGLIR